ncbi:MAG TPA: hypothetical protein VJB92_03850 [Candidatus Paceibacterota bacterium]
MNPNQEEKFFTTRNALIILAAALIVAFAPVIFTGKTLVSSNFHPIGPAPANSASLGRLPLNTWSVDISNAYLGKPVNVLAGKLWRSGEAPLWNPYQGTGVPIAAQTYWSTFFPLQILEDIAPYWLWDFFILLRFWLAGVFVFLFLREIKTPWLGALFGALAYMFSGSFIWFWHLEPYANVAMMAPILFWAGQRILNSLNLSRVGVLGIAFGLMIVSGTPTIIVYAMLAWFAYIAIELWHRRAELKGRFLKTILFLAAGISIGLALSAPFLTLLLEYLSVGYDYRDSLNQLGLSRASFLYLLFQLFPALSVFPAESFPLALINGIWDYAGSALGIGATVLIIAGVWLLARRRFKDFYFAVFLGIGIAIVLKNFGVPPFTWIGYLPVLNSIWTPRWSGPVWAFTLAAAAGRTFGFLISQNSNRGTSSESFFKKAAVPGLIGAASYIALFLIFKYLIPESDLKENYLITKAPDLFLAIKILPIAVAVASLFALRNRLNEPRAGLAFAGIAFLDLWYAVPRGYGLASDSWLLVPFSIGLALLLFMGLSNFSLKKLSLGIPIFLIAFIAVDTTAVNGLPERGDAFNEPAFVKFLKERPDTHEYRVISTDGALMPNLASAYGLEDLNYINAVSPTLWHSFRLNNLHYYCQSGTQNDSYSLWMIGMPETYQTEGKKTVRCRPELDILARRPFYDLLGARYIIMPKEHDINKDWGVEPKDENYFPLIYQKEVNIFENPKAVPRLFSVQEFKKVETLKQAQRLTKSLGESLKKTGVIEKDLSIAILPSRQKSEIEITEARARKIEATVKFETPALTILTDTFFPGWQAYLDGTPAEILRVDGLFRGVAVPAGTHKLIFQYEPEGFKRGLWSAIISLTVILATVVMGVLQPLAGKAALSAAILVILTTGSAFSIATGNSLNLYIHRDSAGKKAAAEATAERERKKILDHIRQTIEQPPSFFPTSELRLQAVEFEEGGWRKGTLTYSDGATRKKISGTFITTSSTGSERAFHKWFFDLFEFQSGKWDVNKPVTGEMLRDATINILKVEPPFNGDSLVDVYFDPKNSQALDITIFFVTGVYEETETGWRLFRGAKDDLPAATDDFGFNEKFGRWEELLN